MDCSAIIEKICSKRLPLTPREQKFCLSFCEQRRKSGNLAVLGNLPEILRLDWLDESLPLETRARKHKNVQPISWQRALEEQALRTLSKFLSLDKESSVLSFLMWRGALAYASSLFVHQIPMVHIEAKRDEKTLEITSPMPLADTDESIIRSHEGLILIPDPMLASGASNAFALDLIKKLGVKNESIVLLSVIAAPEGILRLLSLYPGIRIITASLDSNLNADAFIYPGLGDAGDKYFFCNRIESFLFLQESLSPAQWSQLELLLCRANPN